MPANSPARLPKTTIASATSRPIRKPLLNLRLAPADHRRQEDSGGQERSGDPEDRQLQMPGARDIEGQNPRQIDSEETRDLGAVVLRRGADQRLQQEQRPP